MSATLVAEKPFATVRSRRAPVAKRAPARHGGRGPGLGPRPARTAAMSAPDSLSDLTLLLNTPTEPGLGDDELLPLVYDELRRIAARQMRGESVAHTIQPTALVHEAWLRLVAEKDRVWQNRWHFFAAASEAMRRILIDEARRLSLIHI